MSRRLITSRFIGSDAQQLPKTLPLSYVHDGPQPSTGQFEEQYCRLRDFVDCTLVIYQAELRHFLYPLFIHIFLDLVSKVCCAGGLVLRWSAFMRHSLEGQGKETPPPPHAEPGEWARVSQCPIAA